MTNTKKKSSLAVLALGLVLGFLTIAFFGKAPGAKVCHSPDCATFTQPVTVARAQANISLAPTDTAQTRRAQTNTTAPVFGAKLATR